MSTETMPSPAEIDVLRERLDRLEAERLRALQAEDAKQTALVPRAPRVTGWAADRIAAQDAALAARRRADVQYQAVCEAREVETRPKRDEIRSKLAEIDDKVAAERERHRLAVEKLQSDLPKLRDRLAKLEEPPPRPPVDYSESNRMLWETMTPVPGAQMGDFAEYLANPDASIRHRGG